MRRTVLAFVAFLVLLGCNVEAGAQEDAARLLEEGRGQLGKGDLDAATARLEQALSVYRKNQDREGEAVALKELGNVHYMRSDYKRALELQEQSRALAHEIGDKELEARALNNIGQALEGLNLYDQALASYEKSLEIAQDQKIPAMEMLALGGLSRLLFQQGKYAESIALLEFLVARSRQGANPQVEAQALVYLARAQSSLGNTPAAVARYEEALKPTRETGNKAWEATILQALGAEHYQQQNPKAASQLARQSLAIGQAINNPGIQEEALRLLANLYLTQKDFPRLIETVVQIRVLAKELSGSGLEEVAAELLAKATSELDKANLHPKAHALVLSLLAWAHSEKGDLPKAVEYEENAYKMASEIRFDELAEVAAGSLAVSHALLGNREMEMHWLKESLEISRRTGNRRAEVSTLLQLGDAFYLAGDPVQAVASCSASQRLGNSETALAALRCLLVSYTALGDFDQAGEYAEQARAEMSSVSEPKLRAGVLDAIGNHFFLLGRLKEASDLFLQSAEIRRGTGDPHEVAAAELGFGIAKVLLGDRCEALSHYEKAVDLFAALKDPKLVSFHRLEHLGSMSLLVSAYLVVGENQKALASAQRAWDSIRESDSSPDRAHALHNLGHALFATGALEPAEKALRQAIGEWETVRAALRGGSEAEKASAFDDQTLTYELLQQVLVARGRPEAALEVAEQVRSRAWVTTPSAPPTIASLRRFAHERNVTLVEYSILHDPKEVLLPSRVQGAQPQLEKELFIWVVKPAGEIIFKQVKLDAPRQENTSLAGLARSFRSSLPGRGRGATPLSQEARGNPLRQLHRLLIEPIAAHLPADLDGRVVFVPHGPLFLVPFAALQDGSGRYLLQKHMILTTPSIEALAALRRRKAMADWKGEEILVVGNPAIAAELTGPPVNLKELPGAQREAEAIAGTLGTHALIGSRATREEVVRRLPSLRLIHLASHGLLEDIGDRFIPGALVLAPSGKDNGLLTAREIFEMKLQADLAVLSACDTGGGRITSEGMIGLSRAFLSAGVPSVIVSLWQAKDESTEFLMKRFYQELKSNPDQGRALREAMLATLKAYPATESWAAFTLIGGMGV